MCGCWPSRVGANRVANRDLLCAQRKECCRRTAVYRPTPLLDDDGIVARMIQMYERLLIRCPSTRFARSGHHSLCPPPGLPRGSPRSGRIEWCGRKDSNLHGIATASPSSWCVCQFRHFREEGRAITSPVPGSLAPVSAPALVSRAQEPEWPARSSVPGHVRRPPSFRRRRPDQRRRCRGRR